MFNFGDRIINIIKGEVRDKGIIISCLLRDNNKPRYLIELFNSYNVSNKRVTLWVGKDEIQIDKEYYRDEKIKEILS